MMTDFVLAVLHHVLVFGLFGMFVAELVLVRRGLGGDMLARLARLDRGYGMAAVAVIVVGVCRVLFGLKGWEYYVASHAFWGKMAAFLLIGILSVPPTMAYVRWTRAGAGPVPDAEILRTRRFLTAQGFLFVLVLAFAAAMARGMG